MKLGDIPSGAFIQQSSAPEAGRKVIKTVTKTITLGSTSGDEALSSAKKESQKIADKKQIETKRQEHEARSEQRAEKVKSAILDEASAMRHLKYEVIEEAEMVQVSVVNNSDGAIIRKLPPDKVINIAVKIREKRRRSKKSLDLRA